MLFGGTAHGGTSHDRALAGRRPSAVTEFVRVAHPGIEQPASVPLSALDHYRQAGWFPLDPEHQTATEMVEERVRRLERQARLGVDDTP